METRKIKCYRLEELKGSAQTRVIGRFHAENIYWDTWENERHNSFDAICDCMCMNWSVDYDGEYSVCLGVDYYDAEDMQGASRVIAHIVNHWDFKVPKYVADEKKQQWYRKHEDSLAKNRYEDWMPTGYTSDYCLKEAYDAFVEMARKNKDVTLQDFCDCLADVFNKEYERDYDWKHSDAYVMEMCADSWYAEDGTDITHLVD